MTRSGRFAIVVVALALQQGCLAGTSGADEDAVAADPGSGAKADEAGFVAGHYFNAMWAQAAGEPLVAIFHQADGSEPHGSAGRFDLARHLGDYEFEYLSGYYALLTDRGTPRLRLATAGGEPLADYDWSYASRTLMLGETALTLAPSPAAEERLTCLVVDVVDPTVYEESLSVYEYPAVSVPRAADGTVSLWLGSTVLEAPDAVVAVAERDGATVVTATHDGFQDVISVPNDKLRRGEILAGPASETPTLVARIVCQP
jgi:hypothetical protein